MKASARAYAIQGLIKYHGLRDRTLRIPYHDSISVCMESLPTITTVEQDDRRKKDYVRINGALPRQAQLSRIEDVLRTLRRVASKPAARFRIESCNPPVNGKGLGFSAAGFAALGLAASEALGRRIPLRELSEVVRRGAGSAARSLVGGFSIWHADMNGRSYAEQLAPADSIPLRTLVVPIPSPVKTDTAHQDSVKSPLFKARLKHIDKALSEMKRAIYRRNVELIGRLAENDTLNLHAVTMTGPRGLVLFNPLSITIMNEVKRLREEEKIPSWFSLDTGPSVFVNTTVDAISTVRARLRKLAGGFLTSNPGGPAQLVDKHLF